MSTLEENQRSRNFYVFSCYCLPLRRAPPTASGLHSSSSGLRIYNVPFHVDTSCMEEHVARRQARDRI